MTIGGGTWALQYGEGGVPRAPRDLYIEPPEAVEALCARPSASRTRCGKLPDQIDLTERHAAERHEPWPAALLALLWVDELFAEAKRIGAASGSKPPRHDRLVSVLTEQLSPTGQIEAVCRQLRARDAFWRADPPIRTNGEARQGPML